MKGIVLKCQEMFKWGLGNVPGRGLKCLGTGNVLSGDRQCSSKGNVLMGGSKSSSIGRRNIQWKTRNLFKSVA